MRGSEEPRPEVLHATTGDGVDIAYSVYGTGAPLVFVRALNSHVEQRWDDIRVRRYFQALGHRFTTVWFDARGNGLSGRTARIGLDELVEDLRAIIEHAGLADVTLLGQGFGSPIAIAYAAREPNVVERLILYCAHARGLRITDFFLEMMRKEPRQATMVMVHSSYPDAEAIPKRLLRSLNAEPETATAYFEFVRGVDVRDELANVRCPTLVMQPEHSPVIPHRLGEEIASAVGEAILVTVPGGEYNLWADESFSLTLTAIADFIGEEIPQLPSPRRIAVLVTDIVGSTAMTHRVGEERARAILRRHDSIVRRAVRSYGGAEIKHTGDGLMATFDLPEDALACATEVQKRLRDVGDAESAADQLAVRIGIAFGDVVEEGHDLFGTTVVLAVRLSDLASDGGILVSEPAHDATVREFTFGEPKLVDLKGFPDAVPVYEVRAN